MVTNTYLSNRLVLRVILEKNHGLSIILVYLDKRFISNDQNYKYFHKIIDDKNGFHFYSRNKFLLMANSVRFPDSKNYERGEVSRKTFESEKKRREFLMNLYKALNSWNSEYSEFKLSPDHKNRRLKIKFNGEFWIL